MDEYRIGKYQIIEELGRGGFATVFRARDTTLNRDVALKFLDPMLMRDPNWAMRFRQEAQAIARLDHARIVTIYEVDEVDGRLFIAMQLIRGSSLAEHIKIRGRVGWRETTSIMGQISEGLDYAHRAGVLHRDLKPGNVMLDRMGNAYLTDFGFARLMEGSSYSVSLSGGIIGSPPYIAPEVWEERSPGAPADIYAMGCILYELLIGKPLFTGQSTPAIMRSHFKPIQLPDRWPVGTPQGVKGVLNRALASAPGDRYRHAGDMMRVLAELKQLNQPVRPPVERSAPSRAKEQIVRIRPDATRTPVLKPVQKPVEEPGPRPIPKLVEVRAPAAEVLAQPVSRSMELKAREELSRDAFKYTQIGCIAYLIPPLSLVSIPLWIIALIRSRRLLALPRIDGDAELRAKAEQAYKWARIPLIVQAVALILAICFAAASLSSVIQ